MGREELCFDCQLSGSGICDYLRIREQIINALGLDPEQRQELLDQETAIAISRGCQRITVASPGFTVKS